METNSSQQEILLFKNTSFAHKELYEKEPAKGEKNLSPDDQLEAACWNGWLEEMLPGIVDTNAGGRNLYLWETLHARAFLNIELCEEPRLLDMQYSVNPYAFLATVCYS